MKCYMDDIFWDSLWHPQFFSFEALPSLIFYNPLKKGKILQWGRGENSILITILRFWPSSLVAKESYPAKGCHRCLLRYVVYNGILQLLSLGDKFVSWYENCSWPRPFPNKGKILSREPNNLESSFSHQNVRNRPICNPWKVLFPMIYTFCTIPETDLAFSSNLAF